MASPMRAARDSTLILAQAAAAALGGIDSLLSTVQMPAGIPVGTLAIGPAGATNAALLAIAILGLKRPELRDRLRAYREKRAKAVLEAKLD